MGRNQENLSQTLSADPCMIGTFNERYEIQKGTETENYSGTTISWSTKATLWGKEVEADAKVRERYDSLDSNVESVIKLRGNPTLDYDLYRLKRVSDGQIFKPTAPPICKGEFTKMTKIGVKRG